MGKLAVGIVIDRWEEERGGAERALAALARGLARRGHRVVACAAAGRVDADAPFELRLVSARRGFARGRFERRLGEKLVRAAEDSGCDVVIGVRHLARVDVLWPHGGAHAQTLAAVRSSRARRELAARAPAPWSRHRAFLDLERRALDGGARRIVCVSELVRREFAAEHPKAPLVTIPNAIDLERFHPRARATSGMELRRALGVDDATPLVGCAARNPELKGVVTLLEALARLRSRPWTCVIAGPRDGAAWERQARALGLDRERVRVEEHLEPSAFAAACDLAVLPTWRDTCGLFVLEALASGTPAITTARAGAAELLVDPSAGCVLSRSGDAAALASAIGDRLARVSAGLPAARAAVEGRGLGAFTSAFEQLLRGVAEEKRAERTRA